ncbi:MAG: alpha-L-fucosidase [bacterium]
MKNDPIMSRRELLAAGAALSMSTLLPADARTSATPRTRAAERPRPSARQLAWHRGELTMFVHFTVNTFTGREWGDGTESPTIFRPDKLDARQWARAAKAGGFRRMILTAKHHDGFCLWPTETTDHCVRSSPWRDGKGDVVREFVDACRAEGLGVGLYLSPWDRHERSYGDSPRYNDFYVRQLTELLTRYGPIVETWFDGANGEGPNGRHQEYDWPRIHRTVRELQPGAVIFSDVGPDVRWIGNEQGTAPETNWCQVDPASVPALGVSSPAITRSLQQGDPLGTVWRPGEADVSIRPGWFWHREEDEKVRSLANLVGLYYSSVGHNAGFLLNVPPTPDGVFHDTDVARLSAFGDRIGQSFATNLALGARVRTSSAQDRARQGARALDADLDTHWAPSRAPSPDAPAWLELALPAPQRIDVIALQEAIAEGQHVAYYRVLGHSAAGWRTLSWGTTIGSKKLDRIDPVTVDAVRLEISSAFATPRIAAIGLFRTG